MHQYVDCLSCLITVKSGVCLFKQCNSKSFPAETNPLLLFLCRQCDTEANKRSSDLMIHLRRRIIKTRAEAFLTLSNTTAVRWAFHCHYIENIHKHFQHHMRIFLTFSYLHVFCLIRVIPNFSESELFGIIWSLQTLPPPPCWLILRLPLSL